MEKEFISRASIFSHTLVGIILLAYQTAFSQLTVDFVEKDQQDAKKHLVEILKQYRNHKNASSVIDITITLERLVKTMKSKRPITNENERNPALRTCLALSYFYLGYAKATVGFASDAIFYFNLCEQTDPDVLDFHEILENRRATIGQFISDYVSNLRNNAALVKFRVTTFLADDFIDPKKVEIIPISQEGLGNINSFKFYLLTAIKAYWVQQDVDWKNGDVEDLYFPDGTYKLTSSDSSVEEIKFIVPTASTYYIRPNRWFKLVLPKDAQLGKDIKIYKIDDNNIINEIISPSQLQRMYFGRYRFETSKNYRDCIPKLISFYMKGVVNPVVKQPNEEIINVPHDEKFFFERCR